MNDPTRFLNAFAQALAVMTLYPEGHPSRERAVDAAFQELDTLTGRRRQPRVHLPGRRGRLRQAAAARAEVVGLGAAARRRRHSAARVRAIVSAAISSTRFCEEMLARLTLSSIDTGENRQMRTLGVRFGAVGLEGLAGRRRRRPPLVATLEMALGEEAETFRWLQQEVQTSEAVPLLEAEAVVRSLSVAMHSDRRLVLPLLQLKEFDQYTTTHSLNVAVLSMALAEAHGLPAARSARRWAWPGCCTTSARSAFRIEVLTKPGQVHRRRTAADGSASHRRRPHHPAGRSGSRSRGDRRLRASHHAQRRRLPGAALPPRVRAWRAVWSTCATSTTRSARRRPYREAWPHAQAIAYLDERAGIEFDPKIVATFVRMMQEGHAQVRVLATGHGCAETLRPLRAYCRRFRDIISSDGTGRAVAAEPVGASRFSPSRRRPLVRLRCLPRSSAITSHSSRTTSPSLSSRFFGNARPRPFSRPRPPAPRWGTTSSAPRSSALHRSPRMSRSCCSSSPRSSSRWSRTA